MNPCITGCSRCTAHHHLPLASPGHRPGQHGGRPEFPWYVPSLAAITDDGCFIAERPDLDSVTCHG